MPKIASYKEATSSWQEGLNFLEAKGKDLAKGIDSVQSDWLKQRRSQSNLTVQNRLSLLVCNVL